MLMSAHDYLGFSFAIDLMNLSTSCGSPQVLCPWQNELWGINLQKGGLLAVIGCYTVPRCRGEEAVSNSFSSFLSLGSTWVSKKDLRGVSSQSAIPPKSGSWLWT